MLSTLALFDASLVVLRLNGLLDISRPEWLLLAAAFFISGPGSWALAATTGVSPGAFAAAVAALGGLGVLYSALLTQALRLGAATAPGESIHVLAAATLLLMGIMEMLLVEDARRMLNGAARRCLSGILLYIWPLIVMFTELVADTALEGRMLPLAIYLGGLLYTAAARPPGGSPRCTLLSAALVSSLLALPTARSPVHALLASLLATAYAVAPYTPLTLVDREPSVIGRLVVLGVAAAAASAPAASIDAASLASDALVYALVSAAGWAMTIAVAYASRLTPAIAEAATSPVLRHAAGFALIIAGLHVLGDTMDPGAAVVAAGTAVAAVNTLTRSRGA